MTNSVLRGQLAAFVLAAAPFVSSAADYVSPAGPSDTIDSSIAYDTMTITNCLSVQGGAVVTVPTVTMTGGSLVVTGSGSAFGENRSGETSTRTTYTLNPDAGGAYPLLSAENSGALKIYSATVAAGGAGTGGVFDVLDIDSATAYVRWLYNDSSLTGRVTFAGTAASVTRQGAMASVTEHAIFMRGAWLLALDGGVSATIDVGNQRGILNASGVSVRTTGTGGLTIKDSSTTAMVFNDGVVFDHAGALVMSRSSGNNLGQFSFASGTSIGSNVTRVEAGTDKVSLEIAEGAMINVNDFDFSKDECSVTGGGRIVVDGTAPRTFKAGIPADSLLTLEKTGSAELGISATTNIPNLVVNGGTVRISNDCFVANLSGAVGATLIADGCTVALAGGNYVLGGLELATANGGSFVKTGAGTARLYSPGALGAALHVAEGDAVFSAIGLSQRYWRFTFKGMSGTVPAPVRLRGIYLLGTTGAWENSGIGNSAETADNGYVTEIETPTLAANTARYFVNSSTNVVADPSQSYFKISYLKQLFATTNGGNNRPVLLSPLVDSGNPDSWLSIEFRLNNGGNPITGYNLCNGTGTTSGAYPSAWSVYASDDGETWTEVDSRSGETCQSGSGKYYTYDGGAEYTGDIKGKGVAELQGVLAEHFKFSGYKSNGLEADAAKALSIQVDGGASLDLTAFTVATQKVAAVTIDFTKGGGTVYGGDIASGGMLILKNADGVNLGDALPLLFQNVSDTDNFASWAVIIDGRETGRKVKLRNGRLSFEGGLMIIVR
jgi:hypothetical protein